MYNKFIKTALNSHGYTDFEVGYSISYCQGDGIAWWGTLGSSDLKAIANRLYSTLNIFNLQDRMKNKKKLCLINNVLDFAYHFGSGQVTITHSGRHFHEHSMSVNWEDDFESIYPDGTIQLDGSADNDDTIKDVLGFSVSYEDMHSYQWAWDELMDDIKQDIHDLSVSLYRDASTINESSYQYVELRDDEAVIYERNTDKYKVQIRMCVDSDVLENLSDFDHSHLLVESFLSGESVWGELRAEIIDKDTCELVAVCYGGSDTFDKDKDIPKSIIRQLVSDAVSIYRED